MPTGPLGAPRLTTIGPFVEEDPYDDGFQWAVTDELAHSIWMTVEESDAFNWGPEPALLLEARMDFGFEQENMNTWFMARPRGKTDLEAPQWWQQGGRFNHNFDRDPGWIKFLAPDWDNPPERMKLHSQLYTKHGAMITFDLTQHHGEPASGMIRMPFPDEMGDRGRKALDEDTFEYFEYQYRQYSGQFGDPPDGRFEYYHPHFSSGPVYSDKTYIKWFDRAFNMVERGVRMEE